MPYYRGDYYRGDYYRGDFLGIGKGLKKVGGAIKGAITGFLTGGPVGAVTGAVGAVIKRPTPTMTMPVVQASIPGAIGTAIRVGARVLPPILAGKEALDLAGGFFGGSGGRRRRTMNHLNPRALARSTRRIEGFIKKARKIASPLGYTLQRRGSARCAPRRKCR